MKDIFITSTFRNDWNRAFNTRLAEMFEAQGLAVFLPQRNSEQVGNRRETFLQDVAGIDQCKMIVAVGSKTQTANWGFEIGYAYQKKPIMVITDQEHPVELMPEGAVNRIMVVKDLENTSEYFEELALNIKKYL